MDVAPKTERVLSQRKGIHCVDCNAIIGRHRRHLLFLVSRRNILDQQAVHF